MKIFTSALLLLLLFAAGCKKNESPGDGWITGPTLLYSDNTNAAPFQSFTVDAGGGQTITTAKGIVITLPSSPFTYTNDSIAGGAITLDIREFFSNADFINSFISTVSKQNEILQTGGSFYINAHQGARPLKIRTPLQIQLPNNGNPDAAHRLFYTDAVANTENPLEWQPSLGLITPAAASYNFSIQDYSWWQVAHYPGNGEDGTSIELDLPTGYGGLNTIAWLALPNGGVARFIPNFRSKTFRSPLVPLGTMAKVLLISRKGDGLHYQLADVNVTRSLIYTISSLTSVSSTDLLSIIQGL